MSSFTYLINRFLRYLTFSTKHPSLPEPIFLAGTYFFPQVNVELVLRINNSFIYYSWRDDEFGNHGWHLPGGIIRPNEDILSRVTQVLYTEVNLPNIQFFSSPQYVGFSEVINNSSPCIRSHFLSHVYLIDLEIPSITSISSSSNYLIYDAVPKSLIRNHHRYIPLLDKCFSSDMISPLQY